MYSNVLDGPCERLISLVQSNLHWWRRGLARWAENPPHYRDENGDDAGVLPVPFPTEHLTQDEQIALLAAIHDSCAVGVSKINPWLGSEPQNIRTEELINRYGILVGDRVPKLLQGLDSWHAATIGYFVTGIEKILAARNAPSTCTSTDRNKTLPPLLASAAEPPNSIAINRFSELIPELDDRIKQIYEIMGDIDGGVVDFAEIRLIVFGWTFIAAQLCDQFALVNGYLKPLGLGPDAEVVLEEAKKFRDALHNYGDKLIAIKSIERNGPSNSSEIRAAYRELHNNKLSLMSSTSLLDLSFKEIKARFAAINRPVSTVAEAESAGAAKKSRVTQITANAMAYQMLKKNPNFTDAPRTLTAIAKDIGCATNTLKKTKFYEDVIKVQRPDLVRAAMPSPKAVDMAAAASVSDGRDERDVLDGLAKQELREVARVVNDCGLDEEGKKALILQFDEGSKTGEEIKGIAAMYPPKGKLPKRAFKAV